MSKLNPMTRGGNTIGISNIESKNLLNGKLYRVNMYAVGTANNIESIAVIQHVWKVNHTDDLIDLSAKAFLISLKDV